MQFLGKILIHLAVAFVVRVVIALIDIWLGFDVGEKIAQRIWDQPTENWIQTANWGLALVIAFIFVNVGIILLKRKRGSTVTSKKRRGGRVSLPDATLEAYKATKGTTTAMMAEGFGSVEEFYTSVFTTNSDFPVFGKMVSREGLPSRVTIEIPSDDVRDSRFTNNANDLKSRHSDGVHYTDLEMNKSDLKKIIKIIKGRG